MRKLTEIYGDIRNHIQADFPVVRCSSARTPEQMIREVQAIGRKSLPAVILFLDGMYFLQSDTPIRKWNVTLLLVDQFHAGSEEQTCSAWEHLEKLYRYFPSEGIRINDVFYLPDTVYTNGDSPEHDNSLFFFRLLLQQ